MDIEENEIDRAVRAVREYQKGAATTGFVRSQLKAVKASELKLVAIATRIPLGSLETLRG